MKYIWKVGGEFGRAIGIPPQRFEWNIIISSDNINNVLDAAHAHFNETIAAEHPEVAYTVTDALLLGNVEFEV